LVLLSQSAAAGGQTQHPGQEKQPAVGHWHFVPEPVLVEVVATQDPVHLPMLRQLVLHTNLLPMETHLQLPYYQPIH
jgi:hypothetical protein